MNDTEQERRQDGEQNVRHEDAQITGRTDGPYGSDDSDIDRAVQDNKHHSVVQDSANGLDSVQVRGGQDGRNNRGIGGMDMDSQNGVLRFNDIENNGPEDITEEGLDQAAKTNTSLVSVTTAGPDDYASDASVPVPNAQEEAKRQDNAPDGDDGTENRNNATDTSEQEEKDIAETGTSTTHQPTY